MLWADWIQSASAMLDGTLLARYELGIAVLDPGGRLGVQPVDLAELCSKGRPSAVLHVTCTCCYLPLQLQID